MRCQPRRWLWGVLPLTLPFLGAWYLGSGSLQQDLERSAQRAVENAGHSWARVSMEGRDARIEGEAPSAEAVLDAEEAALEAYGIRRVDRTRVRIAPPPRLEAPNVFAQRRRSGSDVVVEGRWPESEAEGLQVTLAGRTYMLGKDREIASDGRGHWVLQPVLLLADGVYDVTASAIGRLGARSDATVSGALVIDSTPPAEPSLESVTGLPDAAVMTGTFAPLDAATLAVTVGSRHYVLGADAEISTAGETWRLVLEDPLPDGDHDVLVATSDALGNTSSRLYQGGLKIERPRSLAPTVARLETNRPSDAITGTWPDADRSQLEVAVGGRTYVLGRDVELASDGTGRWSLRPAGGLAEGVHDVAVTVRRPLGPTATDESKDEVVVDLTPPAAPTVEASAGRDRRPAVEGTYDAAETDLLEVRISDRLYRLGEGSALTVHGSDWRLEPDADLPEGSHDVAVVTRDRAGNAAEILAPDAVRIDLTPPPAPVIAPLVTSDPAAAIAGRFDPGSARLAVSLDGESYVLGSDRELASDPDGGWRLAPRRPLADGVHPVVAEASDAAGNSATGRGSVTVDTTPPDLPTVDAMITRQAMPTLTGTWPAGESALEVTVGGRLHIPGRSRLSSEDGRWTLALDEPLADGRYDVTARVSDEAGNVSVDATDGELVIDTRSPAVPTVSPSAGTDANPEISGTWPEGDAAALAVRLDGRSFSLGRDAALASDGRGNWTLHPPTSLAPGSFDVAVVVSDLAGNISTDSTRNEILIRPLPEADPEMTGSLSAAPAVDARGPSPAIFGEDPQAGHDTRAQQAVAALPPPEPADSHADAAAERPKTQLPPELSHMTGPEPEAAPSVADAERPKLALVPSLPKMTDLVEPVAPPPAADMPTIAAVRTGEADALRPLTDVVPAQEAGDTATLAPAVRPDPAIIAPEPGEPAAVAPPGITAVAAVPTVSAVDCQTALDDLVTGRSIVFAYDGATIAPESEELIRSLAQEAATCPQVRIEIAGHTDWEGSESYNQALSERRAAAVLEALVHQGVDSDRLTAVGFGKTRPVADNGSDEGRARNRRIEFKVRP